MGSAAPWSRVKKQEILFTPSLVLCWLCWTVIHPCWYAQDWDVSRWGHYRWILQLGQLAESQQGEGLQA